MKQEERSALARQRILKSALREFAGKGYDGASLSAMCAQDGISKGILYHHFLDKEALYLACVSACFDALTRHLATLSLADIAAPARQLEAYFEFRLHFFADNPLYLGIFLQSLMTPPPALAPKIQQIKSAFDQENRTILTRILKSAPLRSGITAQSAAQAVCLYADYFNMRFYASLAEGTPAQQTFEAHEAQCRQQLDMFLYGVIDAAAKP